MDTFERTIRTIDDVICKNISVFDDSDRGLLSQNILAQLRNLVEAVSLKAYSTSTQADLIWDDIVKANEYVKTRSHLNFLDKFHRFLQIVASHYTLDPDNSERLMLKYYEYLLKVKSLLHSGYGIDILNNIDDFPLDLDTNLAEYYEKIAGRIESVYLPGIPQKTSERCYIQKVKPFFVNHQIYYEVTLTLAQDDASKFNRIIAFTKMDIQSCYAIKAAFKDSFINILGKRMPIKIILDWEVSVRPCEMNHFLEIFDIHAQVNDTVEYKELMRFLKMSGMNLVDVVDMSEKQYQTLRENCLAGGRVSHIFMALDKCRMLSAQNKPGVNIVRYLLYHLNNKVIKLQLNTQENDRLSDLYLKNGCIPFDKMPFVSSPISHNPKIYDLFNCISSVGRQHELLARLLRNNTELKAQLYTPKDEIVGFDNIDDLISKYNSLLYSGHSNRRIEEYKGYLYIREYEENTVEIIKRFIELSQEGVNGYTASVDYWLDESSYYIDCDEKREILRRMFSSSHLAMIYGSAGTGKSTLMKHISNFWADRTKLYLAITNPAVDNMRSKVKAPNCTFMTIATFLSRGNDNTEYDFVFIDECSFVSNLDMMRILQKAKFDFLVLVGDVYQIQSISFGNWFSTARAFVPKNAVCELQTPYRSTNESLKDFWFRVRNINDDITECIARGNYSAKLDETIFNIGEDDEITLCLNYDGLYGINNINSFLQSNNPNPPVVWDMLVYKIGDPILFNESKRFMPVIHNNLKGKIVDIGVEEDKIRFDIEIDKAINEFEIFCLDLELIATTEDRKSIVRFYVNKLKTTDEDDTSSKAVVPFQVAYAVSIHKSQGLEYNSVRIIITTEVEELITHNIFYTAITRAKNKLKIYWTPEAQSKVIKNLKHTVNMRDAGLIASKYNLKRIKR